MLNTYNPVLSGIMTAYGLADRIRGAARDEQRMQLERERDEQRMQLEREREKRLMGESAQLAEQRERQATLEDLKMRLGLATSPELSEVGAGATRTVDAAIMDPALQRAYGAPSVSMGVPTEGAIEYGGRRYAVRGPEELLNRQLREKGILSSAENIAAGERARKVFEATAMPVPAELARRAGIPPGTLVSPTEIADILRTVAAGEKEPAAINWQPQMTDQGLVQVNPQTGEVRRPTLAGTTLTRKPRAATGELTAYQRSQQARQGRQDTETQEHAKRAELRRLEIEESQLQGNVLALRVAKETGKDVEGNKLNKALAAAQLAAKENRLKQIRKRKVELGFSTPEEAGLATGGGGAKAAARPPAAPKPTAESFLAKYGIQ